MAIHVIPEKVDATKQVDKDQQTEGIQTQSTAYQAPDTSLGPVASDTSDTGLFGAQSANATDVPAPFSTQSGMTAQGMGAQNEVPEDADAIQQQITEIENRLRDLERDGIRLDEDIIGPLQQMLDSLDPNSAQRLLVEQQLNEALTLKTSMEKEIRELTWQLEDLQEALPEDYGDETESAGPLDTDGDGQIDTDDVDDDNDGFSDTKEAELGTNAKLQDSDGDGLTDWQEVTADFSQMPSSQRTQLGLHQLDNGLWLDPTKFDSYGDGISDARYKPYIQGPATPYDTNTNQPIGGGSGGASDNDTPPTTPPTNPNFPPPAEGTQEVDLGTSSAGGGLGGQGISTQSSGGFGAQTVTGDMSAQDAGSFTGDPDGFSGTPDDVIEYNPETTNNDVIFNFDGTIYLWAEGSSLYVKYMDADGATRVTEIEKYRFRKTYWNGNDEAGIEAPKEDIMYIGPGITYWDMVGATDDQNQIVNGIWANQGTVEKLDYFNDPFLRTADGVLTHDDYFIESKIDGQFNYDERTFTWTDTGDPLVYDIPITIGGYIVKSAKLTQMFTDEGVADSTRFKVILMGENNQILQVDIIETTGGSGIKSDQKFQLNAHDYGVKVDATEIVDMTIKFTGGRGSDYYLGTSTQDGHNPTWFNDKGDRVFMGDGDDIVEGGANDHNVIHGGAGMDILQGGTGSDHLFGEGGGDLIIGGEGNNNTLNGGAGNDLLITRNPNGSDSFVGGAGTDFANSRDDESANGVDRDLSGGEINQMILDALTPIFGEDMPEKIDDLQAEGSTLMDMVAELIFDEAAKMAGGFSSGWDEQNLGFSSSIGFQPNFGNSGPEGEEGGEEPVPPEE